MVAGQAEQGLAASVSPERPFVKRADMCAGVHDGMEAFVVDGSTKRQIGLAGELGFEPRQTESESVVLPLHHSPRIAEQDQWLIAPVGQL